MQSECLVTIGVSKLTVDTQCHVCGKKFERIGTNWGYTVGNKMFCTYRCMRAYEDAQKPKKLKGEGVRG